MSKRRAALVYNPAAGRASEDLEMLKRELGAAYDLSVFETCRERDADVCAREAVRARPELVVAAGGDGTVSLVAGALVGEDIPLGIVARGTANSIATALGIPTDTAGALATMLETGEVRVVDTARANGKTMLLHASVGFHAATVSHTTRDAKNRWGLLAYVKEGVAELGRLEPFRVEVETECEVVRCLATNVTVANVAPLKTLLAQGPAAVIADDGMLDVTIVAATGLAEAVSTGLHLLRQAALGEAATRDNVGYLSARRVRIDQDPEQPLLVDGEEAGQGRLVVVCMPKSLCVMAPPAVPHAPAPEAKLEGLPDLEVKPKAVS